MIDRRALSDHLHLFASLGVQGASRDTAWRERRDGGAQAEPHVQQMDEQAVLGHSANDSGRTEPQVGAAVDPGSGSRPPAGDATGAAEPAEALGALRDHIGACTRCVLHTLGRTQVVFGVGNPNADLMFVGEAPGADEDAQGEPFVGRAGQLLTKIIEAMGFTRDDVYIANVIKCRPPGNRNPEPVEVATCQPFLFKQIDIVRPRVVVALGTFAAHALLGSDAPISRLRGHVHEFRGAAKLVPTFHPAFLLRSPERKRDVWEDMKKVLALLAEPA